MTTLDKDDEVPGRTRALIESRMPQRSLAQLEREIGIENLGRRLQQAANGKYVPIDVIVPISKATGIFVGELVITLFDDAGYKAALPYDEFPPDLLAAVVQILRAEPAERAMLVSLFGWMQTIKQMAAGETPAKPGA